MREKIDTKWVRIAFMLCLYDALAINLAFGIALWLRFDLHFSAIPKSYLLIWRDYIPIHTVMSLVIFSACRLYHSIWRYAGVVELERTLLATACSALLNIAGTSLIFGRMPVSYYFVGWMLEFMAVTGIRFSYRLLRALNMKRRQIGNSGIPTMIIGGGEAGRMLIREIFVSRQLSMKICCIIDDNPNKKGRYLEGVPIVGNRDDILGKAEQYGIQRIIFAIPTATAAERRDILNICKETECELQSLPGIYQLVNKEVSVSQLRRVSVEELLGREPIQVNLGEILEYVQGKVILVTGGGGSIGSELCRQLASHNPSHLIIFDIYENNAYDIQQELKRRYPEMNLTVLIGSVRDAARINDVFSEYRPDIVYHAAAHKHVPLMEDSPNEAIKNNVLGTYNTAMAASKYGVQRFVLISTDKAVNPTNIMGASKRLCEMVIQNMNKHSKTNFVAVRFGNVLGSNGSVIPLFKRQIEEGGPVTVTHPDIVRYFMTIPEAVSLVLQAGAYAKDGEIFVLDMGQAVRIDDLARNLIRLSGLIPDVEIKISYTGLRPGEKLYEEKLMKEEGLQRTENNLIYVGKPIEMDEEDFFKKIGLLRDACYVNSADIRDLVAEIVPTYRPSRGIKISDRSDGGMTEREKGLAEAASTLEEEIPFGPVNINCVESDLRLGYLNVAE